MPAVSIAARLNRLPPTPTHRAATVIAGIGSFFDLFDIFLAGVLGTVLTQEFQLSRLALPAVLGSSFVWMFVLGSLGAAIIWAMRARLPESPRWLESVGRTAEAEAVTARMEHEAAAVGPLGPADPQVLPSSGRARLSVLFGERYRRRTIM